MAAEPVTAVHPYRGAGFGALPGNHRKPVAGDIGEQVPHGGTAQVRGGRAGDHLQHHANPRRRGIEVGQLGDRLDLLAGRELVAAQFARNADLEHTGFAQGLYDFFGQLPGFVASVGVLGQQWAEVGQSLQQRGKLVADVKPGRCGDPDGHARDSLLSCL